MKNRNLGIVVVIVSLIILGAGALMFGGGAYVVAQNSGYVWTDTFCMFVSAGYDYGDMPYYSTKAECEEAKGTDQSALLSNNLVCEEDSQCKSNYCKDSGIGVSFCEDNPFSGTDYVYLTCYDGCTAFKTQQRESTTCSDIGFKALPADTCYEPDEFCGDGKVTGTEECDGNVFPGRKDCIYWGEKWSTPWNAGNMGCTDSCVMDESSCRYEYVKACSQIEGAYCGSWNKNPFKYEATDSVVFCPDGDTCYILKDTTDEEIHTDKDTDGDGLKDWEDDDIFEPVINVDVDLGSGQEPDYDWVPIIALGVVAMLLFFGIVLVAMGSRGKRR